jgi:predicted RNA binding protein with dsRBD fold (UPF0201 family)
MELKVKTNINPTESPEKLLKACENIFPSMEFKVIDGVLEASGSDRDDLAAFKEYLKIQEIKDTTRSFLLGHIDGGTLPFQLNKQAALMGKLNFVDFKIALGAIIVTIQDEDLEGLVEWLCT